MSLFDKDVAIHES